MDVGCGNGFLLNHLYKFSKNTEFIGIDYKINNKNNPHNLRFIKGEILEELYKIKSNSIDFVICTHVLEHLINPKQVVKELKRICRNQLIIICPLEKKFKWGLNYHIHFLTTKSIL